jgi:DNA-directed RNA polymerase subunit F
MPKENKDTGKHLIRAQFVPGSMNAEQRTVDVTFATDTPVLRYSWRYDEYYNEVLDMAGADLGRAANGLPVLDNHGRYGSVGNILGRAENVRIENGVGTAKVRFSKRDNIASIVSDVEDGIIRDISFGYSVTKMERMEKKEGADYRDYIARSWEPNEISFVTIPADPKAGVRGEGDESPEPEIIDNQQRGLDTDMTEAEKKALRDAERQRATEITRAVADAGLSAEFARGLIDNENMTVEAARAAINAEKERVSNDPKAAKEEGMKAERARAAAITTAVKAAKLDDEFARSLVDEGVSIDVARERILAKFAELDPHAGTSGSRVSVGTEEASKIRTGMENALVHRADPTQALTPEGREFRGMDLMDMARFAVEKAGGNTRGLSKREIAMAALNVDSSRAAGMHSTSDFPIVLGNTVNRTLRSAYELYPQTFKPFTRQSSAKDFREKTLAQIGDLTSKFKEIKEGGEYTYGTLGEAKESYKLAKYGQIIAITWETLINDDLGAFNRISQSIGMKAAQLESDIVWGILTGNPTMGDGTALFHADHGNLAGAGTVIDINNLSKAKAAMRKQKSLGKDFLNLTPSFLIVGPDKELEAYQYATANIVANDQSKVNPFASGLQVIVEPRLSGNTWFLSSSPGMIDTIEYAYLEGEQGLFTEQRNGFEVDGLEIKARLVFGAKAIDWRGLYRNPGA